MERYAIGCATCGVVSYEARRKAAFDCAQHLRLSAHKDCEGVFGVTVFDRLAHYGRPDLWSAAGSLLHVKEAK